MLEALPACSTSNEKSRLTCSDSSKIIDQILQQGRGHPLCTHSKLPLLLLMMLPLNSKRCSSSHCKLVPILQHAVGPKPQSCSSRLKLLNFMRMP
eukprot:321659-Amphidinium_carterae.1